MKKKLNSICPILVKFFPMILVAITFIAVFGGQSRADFPEYVDQNSSSTNIRSGICTSDGDIVWDSEFAPMVKNALINAQGQRNYEETAFAFMECYGGGMIDELLPVCGRGSDVSSFTSASRHDGTSWYGDGIALPMGPLWHDPAESYYNRYYSERAGGATVYTNAEAGNYGYDNDEVGPVVQNPLLEHPQYKFTYQLDNKIDVTLHRANIDSDTPDTYRAILFGGSTNCWANYNSLSHTYGSLKARGYTDNEIYLMYPGNTKPDGTALPADWAVDNGTTYQDMQDAWTWMQNQATATTQVYFWSSICHGTKTEGMYLPPSGIEPSYAYSLDLTGDFINQVRDIFHSYEGTPDANSGNPYFQVITSDLLTNLNVVLNNKPLAFLDVNDHASTDHCYKFALDETDIANLLTNSSVVFNWSGGPADFTMAGITAGDMPPNSIPEPATLLLLGLGAAMLRKRKK